VFVAQNVIGGASLTDKVKLALLRQRHRKPHQGGLAGSGAHRQQFSQALSRLPHGLTFAVLYTTKTGKSVDEQIGWTGTTEWPNPPFDGDRIRPIADIVRMPAMADNVI
jgi:hypothetical protein